MRIAFVTPGYYPYIGGVETRVGEISRRLVKKGFEVEVLTTDPSRKLPKEEVINGVRIKRFNSWAPGEAYYFSISLKKYLMKNSNKYNIVHAHSYHAFPALYAAKAKSKNKLIFTPHYHGSGHTLFRSILHIFYKFVGGKIFNVADHIICVSNYERQLILKDFRIDEEKITVIPNGINPEEFKAIKERRKNYSVSKTILYVGRIEKYKGVEHLIKVLPMLDENIYLEIIGRGPYKKSLIKLADKLGVRERVKFYQDLPRKELLKRYAKADLFITLSAHEAFGISVAEALASGTPCIVANTSALKEWVDNEKCFGINYPIDIGKLAMMISKVIGKRISMVKLLNWDEVADKLMKLYYQINAS